MTTIMVNIISDRIQQVDRNREDAHGHEVEAGSGKAAAEHIPKLMVAGTLVQRRRSAATTSTASATGAATTVPVAAALQRRSRNRLLDHDGGSRRRALALLPQGWRDRRRLGDFGTRCRRFLISKLDKATVNGRGRCIKRRPQRNYPGRPRRSIVRLVWMCSLRTAKTIVPAQRHLPLLPCSWSVGMILKASC
jgi:hypothetical protein